MNTINLPPIPSDWIEHSPVVLREGCLPACVSLRKWNEVTPFVVHTAYVNNGVWNYERGDYCRTMEQALEAMKKRIL